MSIRFEARPGPALCFHVLAHLPLGPDAASLHDPRLPVRPWVPGLLEAYLEAPGRLHLQTGVLAHGSPDELYDALTGSTLWGRDDGADRRLAVAVVAAMRERAGEYLTRLGTTPRADRATQGRIAARLEPLRRALWETEGEPPDLTIVDIPALGHRGRATRDASGHLVGTSLAEPEGQITCVLLHEETHPRTDGAVLGGASVAARDTRAGSEGFSIHRSLEEVVLEVDRALLEARDPALLPDYLRWLRRIGAA